MITALVLIAVAGFAVILVRQSDGHVPSRPLSAGERAYVIVALVPVFLALVAPSIIVFTVGTELAVREWSHRLSNFGIWLSLGLTVVGIYLLWRKRRQTEAPSPWLYAAVFVAAVPIGLVALIVALRH